MCFDLFSVLELYSPDSLLKATEIKGYRNVIKNDTPVTPNGRFLSCFSRCLFFAISHKHGLHSLCKQQDNSLKEITPAEALCSDRRILSLNYLIKGAIKCRNLAQ